METFELVTDIILIIAGLYILLMVVCAVYDVIYAIRRNAKARKSRKQAAVQAS